MGKLEKISSDKLKLSPVTFATLLDRETIEIEHTSSMGLIAVLLVLPFSAVPRTQTKPFTLKNLAELADFTSHSSQETGILYP